MTGLVSNTLYAQRARQVSFSAEKLAASAAPFFASGDVQGMESLLHAAAEDIDGCALLVDMDGHVLLDTRIGTEDTSAGQAELLTVLGGEESIAYDVRPMGDDSAGAAAFCAAAVTNEGAQLGAVLLISPVTELHQAILAVEHQLLTVFLGVAAAALAAAFLFAVTLTAPVKALTTAIRRMGKGDLSARVQVHASGEMRELAESYNAMAERIENFDRSRSQFVQNASHELKTPLATMKILLENLIYQPDMPQALRMEFMQDMNHEIDRLSSVVTDLLTLTQMDSHESGVKRDPVDLSALCAETAHALLPVAQKAGLRLETHIEEGVGLLGDASKLGQVAYNLIDNAVKYTPRGGCVTVTLAQEGNTAVMGVRDTGIGIPPEDAKHIFERFYRVDKARSRATGGTGLGLPIVRQMVQLHGGEITVDSAPEEGSVFTVRLPIRKGEMNME